MIPALVVTMLASMVLGVTGHCLLASVASFVAGVCFIGALMERSGGPGV